MFEMVVPGIEWGVDMLRSKELQSALEALLQAYGDGDVIAVQKRGQVLVETMINVIHEYDVEKTR